MKVKVGEITKIKTGKLDANASSIDGKYPFFTCSKEPLKIDTYSYDCECVLVAGNGDLNVKYYKGKFDAYQRTYIIEDNSDGLLYMPYLYYFLEGYIEELRKLSIGGVIKYIKLGNLTDALIELPPIKEQKYIVNLMNTSSELISLRKLTINKLDLLIKARFIEMFGDPEINLMGWAKRPLSSVIVNANNGMARRGNDKDGNIVMRLVELQDGYIDYSNPNRITLQDSEKKRYLLKDKDFLFARVNGNPNNVGRCAVFHDIGEDVYHNDHIIRVHFNELMLNGTFASVLFNSDYGKQQLRGQIKTSAGQYTVSQDGIGAIIAIMPPIELQNQFADFVKQVDKSKLAVQQSLEKTQLLFDSLMQEYFGEN